MEKNTNNQPRPAAIWWVRGNDQNLSPQTLAVREGLGVHSYPLGDCRPPRGLWHLNRENPLKKGGLKVAGGV